jgi:hypothetical protein
LVFSGCSGYFGRKSDSVGGQSGGNRIDAHDSFLSPVASV